MPMPLRFGATTVHFVANLTVTTLPDGQEIIAAAQDNDAYRATAKRLGYGDDTLRMSRQHETAHVWLAHVLGLHESPVMRSVAAETGASDLTNAEEDVVCALARFANLAGADLMAVFARHGGADA